MRDLVARAYETLDGWLALGHETRATPLAWFVRARATPQVYDANFAARVRAETAAEIEVVLAELDRVFEGLDHRQVWWDRDMPQPFEARLVLDGWRLQSDLVVQVLEGRLARHGAAVEIRPAESDADWRAIEELQWLEHQEEVTRGFHPAWEREITRQLVAAKRAKAPGVRYFLARVDGCDGAFFSSWPGENGVGQVEDLFTRSELRGRGIATALLAACVDDARARGAGPVLIAARVDDTPKEMYASLGFRPLCVRRSYLRLCA